VSNKRPWSAPEVEIVRRLYPHFTAKRIAEALDRSERSVYSCANGLGLSKSEEFMRSDASGRIVKGVRRSAGTEFKKGHATWNKGAHYVAGGRSAETRFAKGHRPHTWRPIGHERVSKEGYLQRKVTDTGVTRRDYVSIHHLVWRMHGHEVPRGYALCFRDSDPRNFDINNLELVSRVDLMRRNSVHRLPEELAQVVQLKGALQRQINRREGRTA
jgi:hypothetical protein